MLDFFYNMNSHHNYCLPTVYFINADGSETEMIHKPKAVLMGQVVWFQNWITVPDVVLLLQWINYYNEWNYTSPS